MKEKLAEWEKNFPGKKKVLDSLREWTKSASSLNPEAPEYTPK